MGHMTCDMQKLTYDMWHMAWGTLHIDIWHVTLVGGWTISQNNSFLALPVWKRKCFQDIVTKDDLVSWPITKLFVIMCAYVNTVKMWPHILF